MDAREMVGAVNQACETADKEIAKVDDANLPTTACLHAMNAQRQTLAAVRAMGVYLGNGQTETLVKAVKDTIAETRPKREITFGKLRVSGYSGNDIARVAVVVAVVYLIALQHGFKPGMLINAVKGRAAEVEAVHPHDATDIAGSGG